MIKLLYTINGLRVNGMSAVIMQYITHLEPDEYSISIFTDEIAPQFMPILKKYNVEIIRSENRRKNQIAYYKELKAIMKSHRFDIIHAHGNSATLAVEMSAAKKCGVKVRIAHSHNTTCVHKVFDKLLRHKFYRSYTHGIGCGEEAGKWLFGKHPHVVIKNGIDLNRFAFDKEKGAAVRKQLDIDDKKVIGHIGRFTDQKNHSYLLEVFKRYHEKDPDSVLLLVGDGPLEESIKNRAEEMGIAGHVIFSGTTSDTSAFYSAMNQFVFPSKFEGVPLTLVEAQANGLPCLISDRISKEVIQTELITVLELNDINEWAEHIVLQNRDRTEQSKKSVSQLEKSGFGLEGVIKEIDTLYKTALSRSTK